MLPELLYGVLAFTLGYIIGGRLTKMDTEYPADVYRTGEAAAHIRLAIAALDNPQHARELLEVALRRLNDGR